MDDLTYYVSVTDSM